MSTRLTLVALLSLVVVTSACSGGGNDQQSSPAGPEQYAVQTDPAWELEEAVDLPSADELAITERPPIDWYAEYVRSSADMVRLSGHEASVEEARSELEGLGFTFEPAVVDGHEEALAGESQVEETGPAVVLLGTGSRVLMLLSYEVDVAGLTTFAGTVRGVDEEGWVDAGGVVR